ncbi:phage scaffolding protein [Paenibacillus dendritiformis]|uniref:phage scaffolding protein n=1 Tax=Paenibacillus dendritiformis TaxID=130049 RepID=UPI00387E05F5
MSNETKRFAYPMNLQLFAEGTEPEPTPQDPPVEPTPEPEKTFTQAELDDIVAKRLERERKKYGDYEDLKSKLTEYEREREEKQRAEMTEIERFKSDLEKEQAAKQSLESELTTLRESVKQERIRNAFITAAQAANIAYIDDAWALTDRSGVSVGDDGNIVGIDAVIASLVETKPFLVSQNPTKPKTIGDPSGTPPSPQKTSEQMLQEAAEKARASGRLEDQAAYAKLKRELGL